LVKFYTKTNTELGSKEYPIYEVIYANSEKLIDIAGSTNKKALPVT
jgi:hypothetical protein